MYSFFFSLPRICVVKLPLGKGTPTFLSFFCAYREYVLLRYPNRPREEKNVPDFVALFPPCLPTVQ